MWNGSSRQNPFSFKTLIFNLSMPLKHQSVADYRRSRFLSWLQLTLIVLASMGLVLTILVNENTPRRTGYSVLILGLVTAWLAAYLLGQFGRYRISTSLTVLGAIIGPWGTILIDSQILQNDFIPLVYVSLSIILCSLLLPVAVTGLIAAGQLVALFILSQDPVLAIYNWPSLMGFIFAVSVLSIIVSLINQNDMQLIEKQTRQLAESAGQLQDILDNSTAFIYIKNKDGQYLVVNHLYEDLVDLPRHEIIGKTTYDIFSKHMADAFSTKDQYVLQTRQPLETEETIQQEDGPHTYLSVKFPLSDSSGEVYAMCNVSTDITLRKKAEEAVREQSLRDPLTDLFNRRFMEEALRREIRRARRNNSPVGLVILDIDYFKSINDTSGHTAGDEVLRAMARFLRSNFRGSDVACRYGGDEFLLILPDASPKGTLARIEQLRETFRFFYLKPNNEIPKSITLSVGVAFYPEHGKTGAELLKSADAALYRAKSGGRDRVEISPKTVSSPSKK